MGDNFKIFVAFSESLNFKESNYLCIPSGILKNSDQIVFWLISTFSDEANGREIRPVGKPASFAWGPLNKYETFE